MELLIFEVSNTKDRIRNRELNKPKGEVNMKQDRINLKGTLQQDNVFVNSEVRSLSQMTGLPTWKRLEKAIISEGQIVNVVSGNYGHLPNETFFTAVEEKLINADVNYLTRSINRENRSFAVDYILNDESFHINIKKGADKLKPMLRFTNSYDGSCKTSGHFGFYRELCSNGLHVANTNIGFSVRHTGSISSVVLPEIGQLVEKFMDNEFYSLHKKFEVLAEKQITDLNEFVRITCEELKIFNFHSSEKNPDPSLNARIVIDTIKNESSILKTAPNLWLGYNAFNEILHGKLKKSFEVQKQMDSKLFNTILEMAN